MVGLRPSDSSFVGAVGSGASFSAHLPRLLNLSKPDPHRFSNKENGPGVSSFQDGAFNRVFFEVCKLCHCRERCAPALNSHIFLITVQLNISRLDFANRVRSSL